MSKVKKDDINPYLMKHNLLGMYFHLASDFDLTELSKDPNLIEDKSFTYSNDPYIKMEENLRSQDELIQYKTKNGVYKGYYCPYLMTITTKGIQSYSDKKYLLEYQNEEDKQNERILKKLQIKELRTKWIYAILGWIGGVLSALIIAYLLGVLKLSH